MIPDARTVLHRRFAVLIGLRSLAVVLVAIGIVACGLHLIPLTERLIGFDMWSYSAAIGAAAAVFGLPALALALASSRLSAWIVPAPRAGCPRCGYAVASVDSGVCPECGARFGPSDVPAA